MVHRTAQPTVRPATGPRRYTYLGDRLTDPLLRGQPCEAVLRPDGRCVTGRSAMLVQFDGEIAPRVVLRRLLRRLDARQDMAIR